MIYKNKKKIEKKSEKEPIWIVKVLAMDKVSCVTPKGKRLYEFENKTFNAVKLTVEEVPE